MQDSPLVLERDTLDPARLTVYTLLGAITGAVPLPFLPSEGLRRLRGALLHDAAARHGVSLTSEARNLLAEPIGPAGLSGAFFKLGSALGLRALGTFSPLALLSPVIAGAETLALGHLMDRYLGSLRRERSVRMDVAEARVLRTAMHRALIASVHTTGPSVRKAVPPEDLRDATTQVVDTVLHVAVSVPEWLRGRLDAAFDKEYAVTDGTTDG